MNISKSGKNAIQEFHHWWMTLCKLLCNQWWNGGWKGKIELLPNRSPRQSTTTLSELPFLNTRFLFDVRAQMVLCGSQFSLAALFFISLNDDFQAMWLISLSLTFILRKVVIFFMLLERSWAISKYINSVTHQNTKSIPSHLKTEFIDWYPVFAEFDFNFDCWNVRKNLLSSFLHRI